MEKKLSPSTKLRTKLRDDDDTSVSLAVSRVSFQQRCHPHLRSCRRGVSRASASARSHRNNILFFASSCARCYPTVTAPSHHTTSYPFDRDIKYVIVDASLLHCRVATSGRGCRPQRVDIQRNKSTRAQAFTASPNTPIITPLACGHLPLWPAYPTRA